MRQHRHITNQSRDDANGQNLSCLQEGNHFSGSMMAAEFAQKVRGRQGLVNLGLRQVRGGLITAPSCCCTLGGWAALASSMGMSCRLSSVGAWPLSPAAASKGSPDPVPTAELCSASCADFRACSCSIHSLVCIPCWQQLLHFLAKFPLGQKQQPCNPAFSSFYTQLRQSQRHA